MHSIADLQQRIQQQKQQIHEMDLEITELNQRLVAAEKYARAIADRKCSDDAMAIANYICALSDTF